MHRRRTVLSALGTAALAGCLGEDEPDVPTTVSVDSPAFEHGVTIPQRYTADGANVSPPLSIGNVPEGAASLAFVVDDPDAPNPPFTHWLCWAIPPSTTDVPEDVPRAERVEDLGGARQGTNDLGHLGYGGPAPPPDDGPHRYRFTVATLESQLDLEPGANRGAFDGAAAGKRMAIGRLVGMYER